RNVLGGGGMRWSLISRKLDLRSGFVGGFSLWLATLLLLSAALPQEALAPHHPKKAAPAKAAAASEPADQPYAEAAVMEPVTGTFIFEKNDHQPWPTASLAKMMLMYIVAQKLQDGSLKLTDQISTSREASKMGGSQVYLKEGETFSLDDM